MLLQFEFLMPSLLSFQHLTPDFDQFRILLILRSQGDKRGQLITQKNNICFREASKFHLKSRGNYDVDVLILPISLACQCHPKGSVLNQCDSQTGQCQCAQRVQGKMCHECLYGYWNINSGVGCNKECACDPMGAYDDDCDDVSGQCRCKPGITGITCDQCLPGFWGFSPNGCTSKPKTLSN